MSKIVAIFGATGNQGSSVVNFVLNDPILSQEYKIRAITRDPNSTKSQALASQGIEVVQGDVEDHSSVTTALANVHTIFAMTTSTPVPNSKEIQFNSGKLIADVAVAQGVSYLIFSTLPHVSAISKGKYTAVHPFDVKAEIETYIRGLPIKSAFYSSANFMENFLTQPFLGPKLSEDGTWVMTRNVSASTKFPYIDAVGDTGKIIGAILASPERYEGKTFCAAAAHYSLEEVVGIMSKVTGKKVVYRQVSDEEFREELSMLGPFADVFIEGFHFIEEQGYWGPGGDEAVEWARVNARGELRGLDEFFGENALVLG